MFTGSGLPVLEDIGEAIGNVRRYLAGRGQAELVDQLFRKRLDTTSVRIPVQRQERRRPAPDSIIIEGEFREVSDE